MKKDFDCVEMKRKGGQRVYEIIKDMTVEEEVEYWRKRTAEMRQEVEEKRRAKAAAH